MASPEPKPAPVPPPPPPPGPDRPGRGKACRVYALLVGINEYPPGPRQSPGSPYAGVSTLNGCVSDINKIERYLKTCYAGGGAAPQASIPAQEILDKAADAFQLEDHINVYPIFKDGFAPLSSLHICRLQDKQATYVNIVSAFRNFLSQAGENDMVWFHYSGHGTEAPTARIFKDREDGNDQCLVCYDYMEERDASGRVHLRNLLADKELAYLLSQVAGQDREKAPHIVVTLDACHSGGGTRETLNVGKLPDGYNERMTVVSTDLEFRDLAVNPYLDRFYSRQLEAGKKPEEIEIPIAPHVVITACSNLEVAGESRGLGLTAQDEENEALENEGGNLAFSQESGGYFTAALCEVLSRTGGHISYADLQVQTRAVVSHVRKKQNKNQTPQFEVIGGARSYNRFLEGIRQVDPEKYEVSYRNGHWTIACGIIHGLPSSSHQPKVATTPVQPVEIDIFEFSDATLSNPVAKAVLAEVGPLFSRIAVKEKIAAGQEAPMSPLEGQEASSFYGVLSYLPADPEYVLVAGGTDAQRNSFIAAGEEAMTTGRKNIRFIGSPDPDKAPAAEVIIHADGYQLIDTFSGKSFDPLYDPDKPGEVLADLDKIVNWRRFLALENTDPDSVLSSVLVETDATGNEVRKARITLDVELKGDKGELKPERTEGNKCRLVATDDNDHKEDRGEDPNSRWYQIRPVIRVEGPAPPLHFYLYYLYSNKEIYGEMLAAMGQEHLAGQPAYKREGSFNEYVWGISGEEAKDSLIFKLIVTQEEIPGYTELFQDPIDPASRAGRKPKEKGSTTSFKDWTVVTLALELIREEALAI